MCSFITTSSVWGCMCSRPSSLKEKCVGPFELVCRGQAVGFELDTLQGKLVPVCLPWLQLRGLVAEDEGSWFSATT